MVFSDSLEDVMASYIVDAFNENCGTESVLKFYDGTMPDETTDPDDGTLILTLPMVSAPFSWADDPDRLVMDISLAGANPVADGTMRYWRLKNVSNATVVQGTSGDTGEEVNWNNATVNTGQFPFLTAFTIEITFSSP